MAEIQMSYQEMRVVASDVRTQAEQARTVIELLQQATQRLLPTWEGVSKPAFQTAYDACYKEMVLVPQMLDQVSQALVQTADLVEQAEQQASANITATVTADNA